MTTSMSAIRYLSARLATGSSRYASTACEHTRPRAQAVQLTHVGAQAVQFAHVARDACLPRTHTGVRLPK